MLLHGKELLSTLRVKGSGICFWASLCVQSTTGKHTLSLSFSRIPFTIRRQRLLEGGEYPIHFSNLHLGCTSVHQHDITSSHITSYYHYSIQQFCISVSDMELQPLLKY